MTATTHDLNPEQIHAITAAQQAILADELDLVPTNTALWRANYRFRLAYLRLATEQPWWRGSAEQMTTMRRLADERFPDPYAPTDEPLVNGLPVRWTDAPT